MELERAGRAAEIPTVIDHEALRHCRQPIIGHDSGGRELLAKCTLTVRHGDVFRHELAGAGGWGDPFARDPEHVLRDVLEEKISVGYARREYAVAIDERTATIVPEETAQLRAAARGSLREAVRRRVGLRLQCLTNSRSCPVLTASRFSS